MIFCSENLSKTDKLKIMGIVTLILSDSIASSLLKNKIKNEQIILDPYMCLNHWLKWEKPNAEKYMLALELGFEDYIFWKSNDDNDNEDEIEPLSNKYNTILERFNAACRGGSRKLVDLFIEEIRYEKNTMGLEYGLFNACLGGHMDIVQLMIDEGANMWRFGLEGACAAGNDNMQIIELMIFNDYKYVNGCFYACALNHACYSGCMDLVERIIATGNDDWDSGLAGAAYGRNIEIVKFMLNKGATGFVYALEKVCATPTLGTAKYLSRWRSKFEFNQIIIIDLLISAMEMKVNCSEKTWDWYLVGMSLIKYHKGYDNHMIEVIKNKIQEKKAQKRA